MSHRDAAAGDSACVSLPRAASNSLTVMKVYPASVMDPARRPGCCTTPPPAPRKPSAWTYPASTWPTGRPGPAPRAATRPLDFQTAARLLAKLTAGRQAGPVFLTARRAAAHRVMAAADLDPASGRARLSYEMAGQLFKRYSGGKTLHQLRHSRLTHLGEANVSAPLLMAISGHKRLATLQRYVQPSQAAVAALMAASDPDRRGR
jgi:integrase